MLGELGTLGWAAELEVAGRLLLAVVLGAAVGFEREHALKQAGMRTLAMVSLGAAAFTVASAWGFPGDVSTGRVAAGVVTGIGFLGAGTIFRSGDAVRGLTTAASIWTTASVGVMAGTGLYIGAAATTALALAVLRLLPRPPRNGP
jgi:putative Mg2+ transporter-C (MgtC) family protein